MKECIVVTTLCDKEAIALKIQDTLLAKKLVAGVQISKRNSKYWWNGEIEEACEYHIEMRTRLSLYNKVEEEIKKIHDYQVCEVSYYKIDGASNEFLDWIYKETIN